MSHPMRHLVFWLSLICAAPGTGAEVDLATLRTFSVMGKEEEILKADKEVELLRRDSKGCLTHRWFAMDERIRIRVSVDGQQQPSIDMALDLGHGIDIPPPRLSRILLSDRRREM